MGIRKGEVEERKGSCFREGVFELGFFFFGYGFFVEFVFGL